jgi:predicted membrane protein (TIGR00267 family)
MAKLREFAEYRQIAGIDEIGRRYLAMNAFDGILTMIGVLMGSYVAGIREPRIVISTGLATCLAMGVSGFWGAYLTESAERKHEMQELEHAMLVDMSQSKQARASRFAAIVVSIIDGLSPLVAGMAVLMPFVVCGLWRDVMTSYALSVGIALMLLFALGVFLARVAHERIIPAGVRMIVAGIVCVILSFFLAGGH